MKEDNQHIDDLFKKSLDSVADTPDNHSWEKIKNRLDSDDASEYRRKFIVIRRLTVSLVCFIVVLILYQSLKPFSQNSSQTNSLAPQTTLPGIHDRQSELTNKLSDSKNKIDPSISFQAKLFARKPVNQKKFETTASTLYAALADQFTDSFSSKNIAKSSIEYSSSGYAFSKENISVSLKDNVVARPSGIDLSQPLQHIEIFKPYFSLTFFSSPVWARHNMADNDDYINQQPGNGLSSYQQTNKTTIEQRENELLSYNVGLTAYYHLSWNWGLESGVIFNSIYTNIDPHEIYAVRNGPGNVSYEFVTSSGYGFLKPQSLNMPMPGDSVSTTMAKHKMQYLSVPVLFKYTISFKRFSFSPGIGITANFLTGTSVQTEIKENNQTVSESITKLNGAKGTFLSASANTDFSYSLNRNWMISIVPAFNYAITPVTENNVVLTYPYGFSVGLGFSYRFN
ncbi:MAG TPA: hypothetical protein VGG71_12040 [Chitinophagaceae bacterium]